MKGKQLAIVLILLVAVGGIALFLNRRNAASWSSSATVSDGKILTFPINDVSHIVIKGNGAELNLVKKDDVWKVKERADYPANFELISGLLRKVWELRAVQDVKIGPSQFARLQLGEVDGTLLDLKDVSDKRLTALRLGKKQLRDSDQSLGPGGGFPVGRYVMPVNGSNQVFLVSETFDDVQTKPEAWVNREFMRMENPKSIAVAGATAGVNWKLVRDTASSPWKLPDAKPGEELDSAKASGLATPFAHASFADVLTPDAPTAETGLDKPSTATIETFDNFVYTLRIGKLMGENYPVLVSVQAQLPKERSPGKDEKPEEKAKLDQEFQTTQKKLAERLSNEQKFADRPFLIPKGTIEPLLKDRSALMAEKKPVPSPTTKTSAPNSKGASPAPSSSPQSRSK